MVNGAGDGGVDGGDAFGGGGVGGLDEGNDVADFGFDVGAVAVFLGGIAAKDGGGALELAEGFADGRVAAA